MNPGDYFANERYEDAKLEYELEYVDTPYGPRWREWYRAGFLPAGMMVAQWRRDETGAVWYALYLAA